MSSMTLTEMVKPDIRNDSNPNIQYQSLHDDSDNNIFVQAARDQERLVQSTHGNLYPSIQSTGFVNPQYNNMNNHL